MITAFDHEPFATAIPLQRMPVIQHFVSGSDQEQITFRRDRGNLELMQFSYMLHRKVVLKTGVQIRLTPYQGCEQFVRTYRRVHEHSRYAVTLAQPCCVVTAEG